MQKILRKLSITILLCSSLCSASATSRAFYSDDNEKPNIQSAETILRTGEHNELNFLGKSQRLYNDLFLSGYDRPEVEEFRKVFLSARYNALLNSSMEDAMELRLFVRKQLELENMPPELEYLPVVESYYKTKAKSRSGALGLWQFMANSVQPYLALNDYVDERLDPWKETTAAIKKLQDNYRIFGDWLLAIGAYNCGAGAMSRALAKAEKKDFWYLVEKELIPKQTRDYVPKLLAIADLVINADYYGTGTSLHKEEYETLYNEVNGLFDYVTVQKAYSLKTLAQEMRIDTDTMLQLNPSFIEGFTHPVKESTIRVPLGMGDSAQEALANIKPIDFPVKYKVVKGDTLWGISKHFGVTVSAICELNNIKENSVLSIGKILYIPSK